MRLGDAEVGKRYITLPKRRRIVVTRKTGNRVWIQQDGSNFEIWISSDYAVEPEFASE